MLVVIYVCIAVLFVFIFFLTLKSNVKLKNSKITILLSLEELKARNQILEKEKKEGFGKYIEISKLRKKNATLTNEVSITKQKFILLQDSYNKLKSNQS